MNSTSDKKERARKKRRSLVFGLAAIALSYLVLSFFLGEKGLLRYVHLNQQRAALATEVGALRSSNDTLREKVQALKTDPVYIERLAREQGMVKEGEKVYQYEDDK